MGLWKFIGLLTRRWTVVLIGAVCTVAAGLAATADPGVYFARTTLAFLAPTSAAYPNALRSQSDAIIETAGLVAKRMTGPDRVTKFASPDVTLVGVGVRDGWSLRQPDTGGQWAPNFATQTLVLDVVGPSRDVVAERRDALVQRTQQELYLMQRDAGVKPVNDITLIPVPDSPVVYHVQGSRLGALGMTALLGVLVTSGAVLEIERRRQSRSSTEARTDQRETRQHASPLALARAGSSG